MATISRRTRIHLINKTLMMIFNRRKWTDQNMELIILLHHIRNQIPFPKTPCVHTATRTQDYHRVVVDGNISSIKKKENKYVSGSVNDDWKHHLAQSTSLCDEYETDDIIISALCTLTTSTWPTIQHYVKLKTGFLTCS